MNFKEKVRKNQENSIREEDRETMELINEIVDAKNNSEQRAGLIKTTDEGFVENHKKIIPTSIHTFKNIQVCECKCHNSGKNDCMECYDHPTHLTNFK